MHAYGNHLRHALRALRESIEGFVDMSTDIDRPRWYDVIEGLIERHAAKSLRRLAREEDKRSTSEGERSSFEGDRSNSEGDRGKNSRAGASSVGVATKSGRARDKVQGDRDTS